MIATMASLIQRFLFDRSDDAPSPEAPRPRPGRYHNIYRPRLTKEQRDARRRQRERWERRQVFFFGPRVKRGKRNKNLFHLVPDVPVDQVERDDPELHELAQLTIYNRAQMIQQTWSENKLRKRNNFYVEPLTYRPINDDLHLDQRNHE